MKDRIVKIGALLFFISLVYTFGINALNVYHIKLQNPSNTESNAQSLVYGSTVYSIDNYWYVNHVKNYMLSGRFTVDTTKTFYEVRRTPVYPLFYGAHYWIFGEEKSYYFIRFTQAIILAIATVLLFLAVFNFTGNTVMGLLAALLYAFQPGVVIGTHFTNSESLSSQLVCLILYSLSVTKLRPDRKNWIISGAVFALGVLCRPSIIFLAPSFFLAFLFFSSWNIKKSIQAGLLFGLGAACLFLPWTVRNYKVTGGDFVVLEKYYGDPMDYGMPNIHLRKWIACWINPADYSSERISNYMGNNLLEKEPVSKTYLIDSMLSKIPEKAFTGNDKQAVKNAYAALYDFYQYKYFPVSAVSLDSVEQVANEALVRLKSNFIRTAPLDYYIITPLLFSKSIIFQSNATSARFLDDYSGNYLKTGAKALLYAVNVFSFLAFLFMLIYFRKHYQLYLISLVYTVCTFLLIIYSLQYFESRYIFPLFPFLYAILAICIVEVYRSLRKRLHF
jgi:4-amino-4-deoxy-L-arabinose transferase-like glycosyltransferase